MLHYTEGMQNEPVCADEPGWAGVRQSSVID